MKKAGAIIRVSTARQLDGTSPEKQIEKILALASQHGCEIEPKHVWQIAESGGSRERLGFKQALTAGEKGEISRLYVFNIDRLGRDLLEMLLFLRRLEDLGIDCWGAEKGQQLVGNDFLFQIEGAVASKERQEIVKRTQDGLIRAIKAGKYSGGIVSYGYRINPDSKTLELEPSEADVIRTIFRWCADERISCVTIAERLNAMAISTRYQRDGRLVRRTGKRAPEKTDGVWRAGRIRNLLRNPAYMGKWVWGKRSKKRTRPEVIPGSCPPIVSEETFARAGVILEQNQLFLASNGHRNYLLRGLIKCGLCGKTFCGSYSRVGPGKSREKSYYLCNGKTQWRKLAKPRCPAPSVHAEDIEAVVWEDVKAFCKHPDTVLAQLRLQRGPAGDGIEITLSQAQSQLAEFKRQERNLLTIASKSQEVDLAALDGLLSDNHRAQAELVAYLDDVEAQKRRISMMEDELVGVSDRLAQLGSRIDQASFEERRRAVEVLVKGIEVQPQTLAGKVVPVVTITYRFGELGENPVASPAAMVADCTPARAATLGMHSRPARALPQR